VSDSIPRAIVIGGGIGGLTTAIRLAVAGWQVAVFEKNPAVGGKMSELRRDGFRWDTGPSVITMRHVFEELFADAGRRLEDYLTLLPIDPLTRYFYPDGIVLDATSDPVKMAQQIVEIDPQDITGYQNYLRYASEIYRVTSPVFIYDRPPSVRSFSKVPVRDWLKADPLRLMQRAIEGYVKSPQLRQLLGRFATYVGGSPYRAPATLNLIAYLEMVEGVWYPQDGVYAIAQALQRLAEELGVIIYTNTSVQQILIRDNRAAGVRLKDGSEFHAEAVIANVDVTTLYERLLPKAPRIQKRLRQLKGFEPSCSGFVMMLGVQGKHERLAHHNILFSADYRREFVEIFEQDVPPTEPTIYIAITSKTDPTHAPSGCENWFLLVNAPALSADFDWTTQRQPYRELILDRIAEFGFDIRDRIISETIWTPTELQQQSAAYRGALYGPSANSQWTAFRRPHNRCPDMRGLYFAGGTTHPGGGVPMVMLSGKVVSALVLEDHKKKKIL
jgi:phytoene desaturase